MTFMSYFDKLQFCPYILYKFRVSQFPCFVFKLRKIHIMSIKYPKHAENDLGIFQGVTLRSDKAMIVKKADMWP